MNIVLHISENIENYVGKYKINWWLNLTEKQFPFRTVDKRASIVPVKHSFSILKWVKGLPANRQNNKITTIPPDGGKNMIHHFFIFISKDRSL
jgi:hypothetical protein